MRRAGLTARLRVHMGHGFPGIEIDHIRYNHPGTLPQAPQRPIDDHDFQVIMLPLRTVMPEQMYFGLHHNDPAACARAFEQACERLHQMLHVALACREQRQIITFRLRADQQVQPVQPRRASPS